MRNANADTQVGNLSRINYPLIIAHRGASKEAPENTMPSFRRAIELGADGIELDVMLTRDNVPVVTHYNDLSVLTNHRGRIHETPFATIKTLDMGSHFNPAFQGVTCPTLPEVLDLTSKLMITTIVEIKAQPGKIANIADLIGGVVSDFKFCGNVTISSSNLKIVYSLARKYSNLERAYVLSLGSPGLVWSGIITKTIKLNSIHVSKDIIGKHLADRVHKNGQSLFVWTVNSEKELIKCINLKADGIITDDPAFVKKWFCQKLS